MNPGWNWKVALASGIYRSSGFIASSWRFGAEEAVRAGAVEFVVFTTLAGFTGAAIQRVRDLQPAWMAAGGVAVVIPAVLHTAEWLAHRAAHSAGRGRAVIVSIGMTVLAELFSWYAMKQGVMLTGGEGRTLGEDLMRMPGLIGGFLLWVTVQRPESRQADWDQ